MKTPGFFFFPAPRAGAPRRSSHSQVLGNSTAVRIGMWHQKRGDWQGRDWRRGVKVQLNGRATNGEYVAGVGWKLHLEREQCKTM